LFKGLNQQKTAKDIDLRAPGGRRSLWTTDEKTHGLPFTLITHISAFPASNRMVSSQNFLALLGLSVRIWDIGKFWQILILKVL
jgi:hypothetical protein